MIKCHLKSRVSSTLNTFSLEISFWQMHYLAAEHRMDIFGMCVWNDLIKVQHVSDIFLYIFMIFSLNICRYEWNKDGNAVQNSQFVSIDKSTGTLKFIKMQNEDYGTYQCFATNKYGTSISVPLKVKESSKFLLTSFKW